MKVQSSTEPDGAGADPFSAALSGDAIPRMVAPNRLPKRRAMLMLSIVKWNQMRFAGA
ncbi:hypothetical protein [Streptomyces brevispora]|uniref:hypothetical protein n=1 Tax=Streptomyces brevispora TaxID=887462 RepID=UPI003816A733